MAQKRMFNLKIVDTDEFLDMPPTTQNLYFHLGMRADDDGFVSNPKKIMKIVNSANDDMKVLVGKSFVIPFDSGICVIKHWKIHNLIRSDRYTETEYKKEKELLIEEDKKYKLNNGIQNDIPNDIPNGNPVKVRLDKLNKDNTVGKADEENKKEKNKLNVPFSYKEKLELMKKDPKKHIRIIAYFWQYKAISIDNEKQYQTLIKRSVKPANELTGFSYERINEVMDWLANVSNINKWELETVIKYISEDLDNLKPFKEKQNYGNY